jgi:hypothetical protein
MSKSAATIIEIVLNATSTGVPLMLECTIGSIYARLQSIIAARVGAVDEAHIVEFPLELLLQRRGVEQPRRAAGGTSECRGTRGQNQWTLS